MKKMMALLILAAVAAMPMAASAADGFLYADVLSAYVSNGQVGNDEAVFQPGLDVSGPYGLTYSFWANMALTDAESAWDPNTGGEWNELDLGLSWTVPYEAPVSLSFGGTYYVYPQAEGSADGSYEVFAKLSADDTLLTPAIKFCHDLDNQEDWIAKFSVGHSFSLMEALSLNLGATVGFAGDYYIESNYNSDSGSAFSHVQLDAGLNYAVSEQVSLGLKGAFSSIIDSEVRDDIEESDFYPDVDIFFGGVTASYAF